MGSEDTRGTITVSGKWTASSPAKRRSMLPPASQPRAIAAMRPAVERVARVLGDDLRRQAVDVVRDRGQEDAVVMPAVRPRARTSSRA